MDLEIFYVYLKGLFYFKFSSLSVYQYILGGNKTTGNIAKGQEFYYTSNVMEIIPEMHTIQKSTQNTEILQKLMGQWIIVFGIEDSLKFWPHLA